MSIVQIIATGRAGFGLRYCTSEESFTATVSDLQTINASRATALWSCCKMLQALQKRACKGTCENLPNPPKCRSGRVDSELVFARSRPVRTWPAACSPGPFASHPARTRALSPSASAASQAHAATLAAPQRPPSCDLVRHGAVGPAWALSPCETLRSQAEGGKKRLASIAVIGRCPQSTKDSSMMLHACRVTVLLPPVLEVEAWPAWPAHGA